MRQRVAYGQQQPVGGRQRRCQPAGRHQAGHYIGQPPQLGRGEHHDVGSQAQLGKLQNAVLVHVLHRQQARVQLGPLRHPGRQRIKALAHQVRQHLVLHQHRQRRRTDVEQHDEQQRPGDRGACFGHTGRGEKPRQQVRQPDRADHQAEHQRQKIAPAEVESLLLRRRTLRIAGKHLGDGRNAGQRLGTLQVVLHFPRPTFARAVGVLGQAGQFAAGGKHGQRVGAGFAQMAQLVCRNGTVRRQRRIDMAELAFELLRVALVDVDHRQLGRVDHQRTLTLGNLVELRAIHQRRQRTAQLLVRQPGHRHQKC